MEILKDIIELIEYPVLIIDKSGQVIYYNTKFKDFSWIKDLKGRYYFEILRFSEAHEVLKDNKLEYYEKEISLGTDATKYTFLIKSIGDLKFIALKPGESKATSDLKKKLLGQISHELKTPITVISSIVETGEATGKIDSIFSRKLLNNIKRLDFALDNAIIITKIQLGLINSQKTKINLLSFLEDLINNSLPEVLHSNIKLNVEKKIVVESNPYILKTITKNIFLNSLIHGKEPIFVDFYDNKLIIRDSGDGFKEGELKELSRENSSGIGLGTAIIKSLARLSNIQTTFSNENGAKVELKF